MLAEYRSAVLARFVPVVPGGHAVRQLMGGEQADVAQSGEPGLLLHFGRGQEGEGGCPVGLLERRIADSGDRRRVGIEHEFGISARRPADGTGGDPRFRIADDEHQREALAVLALAPDLPDVIGFRLR